MKRLLLVLALTAVAACSKGAPSTETQVTQAALTQPRLTVTSRPQATTSQRTVLAGTDKIAPTPAATTEEVALHRTARARQLERVFTIGVSGAVKRPHRIAIAAAGYYLAVQYTDATIAVWQLDSLRPVFKIAIPTETLPPFRTMVLSADGRFLAFAVSEDSVEIWDVRKNRLIARARKMEATRILRFSQDGRRLLMAGFVMGYYDIAAKRFSGVEIGSGQPANSTLFGLSEASDAVFGPGGNSIVASTGEYFATWSPGRARSRFVECGCSGYEASVSPDGATVAFPTSSRRVSLWDVRSRRELANWRLMNPSSRTFYLGRSGLLAVGGSTADVRRPIPTVELFRLPVGKPVARLTFPRDIVGSVDSFAYDPRGFLIVGASSGDPNRPIFRVYELT
jgi:WD40 repeat protein